MHSIYFWQQQEWQNLLNRKNNGQLPHALLIKGAEGLGKYQFAQCLAELLLCQGSSDKACEKCKSCQLLESGNHPDLLNIRPEEQNKAIKIDLIRDVVSDLNNTSQQGGYKIVVIDHADMLNMAASNALLKTLEEPASNVIIVLISNHPAGLPATIRSRCQTIAIKPPSRTEALKWLEQNSKDDNILLAIALAENAPLKALSLLREENLNKRLDFFNCLYKSQNKKISSVEAAKQLLDLDFKFFLTTLTQTIADIIKIKFEALENVVNQDQIKALKQLAAQTNLTRLFNYQAQLFKVKHLTFRNINFNQQLTTESLTIALSKLFIK